MNDVTRLPVVLSENPSDQFLEFELEVPDDLVYAEGHFPDFPLVPGVVQVDWVIQLLDEYNEGSVELDGIDVLKFNKMLRPGDRTTLRVEWDTESTPVKFTYSSAGTNVSTGRLTVTLE